MITYKIRRKEIVKTDYVVEAKDFDEAIMKIESGAYESDELFFQDENYSVLEKSSTITNATDIEMLNHWGEIDGTSLQGYMDISYDDLVKKLGKPNMETDQYKVDAEWGIRFPDTGEVATIYNYKTGKNYDPQYGLDVKNIRDWHIGGHSKKIVARVCKLLNTKALDYLTARYGGNND